MAALGNSIANDRREGSLGRDDSLKLLTLDLLCGTRMTHVARLGRLDDDDWRTILRMVRQHRIGPMLRWQLRHANAHLRLPAYIDKELADQAETWTLRNLAVQRELLRVHGILEAAAIPYVALKGAHLAFAVYPQLALRPLRDIDILVPHDQAADAYATLVKGGLLPSKRHWRHILGEGTFAHSLPHLRSPCNTINIDIHRRMLRMHALKDLDSDPSSSPAFWSSLSSMSVQGVRIPITRAETLLLHVAAHAALEHHFDNGPLLLSDLAFLVRAETVDWGTLWKMASKAGATRALALALALSRRYASAPSHPASIPLSPADRPSDELVDLAAIALLAPHEGSHEIRALERVRRKARAGSWMREAWRTFLPSRQTIAAQFDIPPNSADAYLAYPKRWWGLIRNKSLMSLWHRPHPEAAPHRQRAQRVARWVDGTTP